MSRVQDYAFFTVHDEHKTDELVRFAQGVTEFLPIASSGGTARYLFSHDVEVTPVRELVVKSLARRLHNSTRPAIESLCVPTLDEIADELAGDAILHHRVVTLRPEVMGPILACEDMLAELEELGMCRIVLVRTSFYPLKQEIERVGSTPESVREQTDIGGPTGIMAAVKANRLAVIDPDQHDEALAYLRGGSQNATTLLRFQTRAARTVQAYIGSFADYLSRLAVEAEDRVSA